MAEGLLRHDAGDRFEVFSAGTRPSAIRPEANAVMRELGIDLGQHRSKHVDSFAGQVFDYVLTVCDNAKESCPIFSGPTVRIRRGFEDPAVLTGSEEEGWHCSAGCATRSGSICERLRASSDRSCVIYAEILACLGSGLRPCPH
jgi:arsenate reductase